MERTYYQEPSRLTFLLRHGWGRPLLVGGVLAVLGGYLWLRSGESSRAVLPESYTQVVEKLDLNGAAPTKAAVAEPDLLKTFLEQYRKDQAATRAREEQLQRELEALKQQKPAQTKEAPKPRPHRPMGHLTFAQPEDKTTEVPRYTLAPGDTKIPCIAETTANSDVENGATVKVTVNVYDTATRRRLLIPQGATILQEYKSDDLLYGNQRLPMYSTLLTLPDGTVHDLESTPTMDQEGQAGLVTRVNNHFWRAVPLVLIQGVMRGSQQMVATTNPLAGGVAGSATQYGEKITRPYVDLRPTIEVDGGEGCLVILRRSLELPEYRERR